MYDVEKFPILEIITREEHYNIVQYDFFWGGELSQKLCIFMKTNFMTSIYLKS